MKYNDLASSLCSSLSPFALRGEEDPFDSTSLERRRDGEVMVSVNVSGRVTLTE